MSEVEKIAERLEAGAFDFNADGPCWPGDDMAEATAFIRRLVAEKAELVEAARPFAYLVEGDFYPTKCEVERLRAAIEEVNRE